MTNRELVTAALVFAGVLVLVLIARSCQLTHECLVYTHVGPDRCKAVYGWP